ncbi:MAG TPA: L,D-transpeptidase, partial [Candidatus Eisenbacteria bacterium]|nr:L,D-transpeptidase [Candidatus Eisenbacteria bacterium]
MKARRTAVLGLGLALAVSLLPGAAGATAAPTAGVQVSSATASPAALTQVRKGIGVTITPAAGARVGVAYPITARFSAPVYRKSVAERRMKVYVNGTLAAGAWYWKDSQTALFRTKRFWPGRAGVQVRLDLAGVVLAETSRVRYVGFAGTDRRHTFRTVRARVHKINAETHRMRTFVDGTLVKVSPVSLGKPGFLTRSGVKAVMEKYPTRRMTSEGAGITDPNDQYDVIATWAVRLTPTGEFVHGASWATARIGRSNGSHGCTNLTDADAKYFYDRAVVGDPVLTYRTGRRMEPWNGLGGPW